MLVRVSRTFADDDLDIEILLHDPHFVVVGARSPWTRRRKLTLAELVNEPWIFPPNRVVMGLIEEAFEANGLEVALRKRERRFDPAAQSIARERPLHHDAPGLCASLHCKTVVA